MGRALAGSDGEGGDCPSKLPLGWGGIRFLAPYLWYSLAGRSPIVRGMLPTRLVKPSLILLAVVLGHGLLAPAARAQQAKDLTRSLPVAGQLDENGKPQGEGWGGAGGK